MPAKRCRVAADRVSVAAATGRRNGRAIIDGVRQRENKMAVRIVRPGSPPVPGEGLRIGTVRRPPRGVPKSEFAQRDFYDVWFPNLAPSEALLKRGQAATDERAWKAFARAYRAEMKDPAAARTLDLLAALSQKTN